MLNSSPRQCSAAPLPAAAALNIQADRDEQCDDLMQHAGEVRKQLLLPMGHSKTQMLPEDPDVSIATLAVARRGREETAGGGRSHRRA